MPAVFTFYKVSEKVPEHNQDIIWLSQVTSFDYYYYNPREITVEYHWAEYDEEGYCTGTFVSYNGEPEEDMAKIGYRLEFQFDGQPSEPDYLWMPIEDYCNVLGLVYKKEETLLI